jgi:hypothetical protein
MAPSEVHTLQAIAKAHGGSLTVNPDTGLPEAGFLSSILPMIAGVGLTAISGGTLSPLMAGMLTGGGTALATGNLQKGLMAGLGAYGGAGLGSALATTGGNALTQEALLKANPGLSAIDIAQNGAGFTAPQMSMTDKMLAGVKGLGDEAGRDAFMQNVGGAKGLFKSAYSAALPVMLSQSGQTARPPSGGGGNPYEYDFNPGYTGPVTTSGGGTRYFDPRYVLRKADGGETYADGGETGMTGQSDEYYRYLMGLAPAPLPAAYTGGAATQANTAPLAVTNPLATTVPLSFYEQALARMTPAQLAAHEAGIAATKDLGNQGPGAPTPAEVNEQAMANSFGENGLPNAIVSGLVPVANMMGITSPQQGALQGLITSMLTGNPAGILGGAALGNAAQIAQMTNMSQIAESNNSQGATAPTATQADNDDTDAGQAMLAGLDPAGLAAINAAISSAATSAASSQANEEMNASLGTGSPTAPSAPGAPGAPGVTQADLDDAASGVAADVNAANEAGIAAGIDASEFARGGISAAYAQGGYNLGDYSDGGRLLRGPGDGVSDSIPASIADKRPARLADGEFVVPARIVSELGNGSTDAGARRLYEMMDRIQQNRAKTVGKGKVAVNSRAARHLPA